VPFFEWSGVCPLTIRRPQTTAASSAKSQRESKFTKRVKPEPKLPAMPAGSQSLNSWWPGTELNRRHANFQSAERSATARGWSVDTHSAWWYPLRYLLACPVATPRAVVLVTENVPAQHAAPPIRRTATPASVAAPRSPPPPWRGAGRCSQDLGPARAASSAPGTWGRRGSRERPRSTASRAPCPPRRRSGTPRRGSRASRLRTPSAASASRAGAACGRTGVLSAPRRSPRRRRPRSPRPLPAPCARPASPG